MNGENTEDYLFGRADTEEDQPMEIQDANGKDRLDERRLAAEERDKERKEKRYFTAFSLIKICLAIIVGIYVIETVIGCVTGDGSGEVASSAMEIVKTLLFTLSGYLFARKENGD